MFLEITVRTNRFPWYKIIYLKATRHSVMTKNSNTQSKILGVKILDTEK